MRARLCASASNMQNLLFILSILYTYFEYVAGFGSTILGRIFVFVLFVFRICVFVCVTIGQSIGRRQKKRTKITSGKCVKCNLAGHVFTVCSLVISSLTNFKFYFRLYKINCFAFRSSDDGEVTVGGYIRRIKLDK